MQATVEPLENNRVKLSVEVPADEFETAIDAAFRKIAKEVRLPGFRPGKAPRRILEARIGTEAARQQALQDALPSYYADAVIEHDVDVIAPPEIKITAGEDEGDIAFEAVVEVRPQVHLVGYDELHVTVPYKPVDDEAVDAQVNRLRDQHATLQESSRPLARDDFATLDIRGTKDGEDVEGLVATDFLYPVGSGMIVDELDDQLRSTKPGEILEFDSVLPERFGERAGETVHFRVLVKNAQEKVLPDLTDEWVDENTEYETVTELRDAIRTRTDLMGRLQAQMAVRDLVLDAAGDLVTVMPPETLVDNEMRSRLNDLAHRLEHQGATVEQYLGFLQSNGQEPQEFIDQMREGAKKAVLADLALRAVADQEEITASDDEVDAEVARIAERNGQKVEKVRRELERGGVLEAVRSELARGKALQFLVDHADVVDEEGNPLDIAIDADTLNATDVADTEHTADIPADHEGTPESAEQAEEGSES
jgi:trigger factor